MEEKKIDKLAEIYIKELDVQYYISKEDFVLGAEWQKKRMYSEEDLKEAFKQSRQCKIFEEYMPPVYESFEEFFKEFKNK